MIRGTCRPSPEDRAGSGQGLALGVRETLTGWAAEGVWERGPPSRVRPGGRGGGADVGATHTSSGATRVHGVVKGGKRPSVELCVGAHAKSLQSWV